MTDALIDPLNRQQLRQELRAQRHKLSPKDQQHASMHVLKHLMKQPVFMRSQHVALYLAADGELDPSIVARQLWKMNKTCYLPVLHPNNGSKQLWFVKYEFDTPLKINRYGIGEPDPFQNHKLPAHLLDCALVPLVGFDRSGSRLGMGGGFYDYTFAFKQQRSKGKPYLFGLAHSCQELPSLALASWDIPLYGIATEREMILCDRP